RQISGQIRLDHPRRDGVDGDLTRADLAGQRFGQPDQPGFAGAVIGLSRLSGDSAHTGDVDDPPVAFADHDSGGSFRTVPGAFQIGINHLVPIVLFELDDQAVARYPGVVYQDIDGAVGFDGNFDECFGVFEMADVGFVRDGLTACRLDRRYNLVRCV